MAASAVAGSRLSHHFVVLALPSSGNSPWTGFPVLNTVVLGFPSWPWMTDFTLCTFKPQPHCLCWWLVPVTELGWDFLTDSVWLFPVLGHCKRMQPEGLQAAVADSGDHKELGRYIVTGRALRQDFLREPHVSDSELISFQRWLIIPTYCQSPRGPLLRTHLPSGPP